MLDRLVAGVLHPFIQVGFGLEFRDQVMLAEGWVNSKQSIDG
jgi:uncharacterized protein YhjY with autotransporter beta-barrel domain